MPKGVKALLGQVFAEKGSRSQERFDLLFEPGIRLVTQPRKNLKKRGMPLLDQRRLGKRAALKRLVTP
ncbi:hypothetical protein HYR99_17190 [Candidatus Poribacteria bacterium]|nr:hypothetical protein [Candidatus Poribacteria bacterium]